MSAPRRRKSSASPATPEAVSVVPKAATPVQPEGILDQARVHLYQLAGQMTSRFVARLKDPDYRPTPNDLSAVFNAIRSLEEHASGLSASFGRLAELRNHVAALSADLKAAEDRLLALLSAPKPDGR
jgi:hypothetical protein